MRRKTQDATAQSAPEARSAEQRRLPRKQVLLDGLLTDATGRTAWPCVIHDIHAKGAAVSLKTAVPVGALVCLLDIANRTAHEARAVWSKPDRTGLLFVRSYKMDLGLPPKLNFLWRLLLDAKLRQAKRAVTAGASGQLALNSVGLTREHIRQMTRFAASDERFRALLLSAERLLDDQ